MEKDDSLKRNDSLEVKESSRRSKRSLSISALSMSLVEVLANDLDPKNTDEEPGNTPPSKKPNRNKPGGYSLVNEVYIRNPTSDIESDFEAEKINAKTSSNELKQLFHSPGPGAPIRQSSKGFLMEEIGVEESSSAPVGLYFDPKQEGSSPSSSPRAKSLIKSSEVNSGARNNF
jgi:hypothetical protein